MPQRIPRTTSPVEVRQAFQRRAFETDALTTGTTGQVLIGQGIGVLPVWTTSLTALTLLTVDNITIDAATILSDTGAISFGNENLTTTGTVAGINITSGTDPGHTHTGASLSGIDISADTNLAVTAPVVLTDDTLSLNQSGVDHGSIGGLNDADHDAVYYQESEHINSSAGAGDAGKPIILDAAGHVDATMINDGDVDHGGVGGLGGDDHTIYLLADGTRALTGNLSVDALVTIDGRDISVDGTALDTAVGLQHVEAHSIASHNDTTATGAELNTLTDNSVANVLHRHSELVASDGAPDPALAVDADGAITIGGTLGVTGAITGPNVSSGANPGHTHTGTSLSGIDISADTNLAVSAPIVLTDDTLSLDYEATDFSVAGTTLTITNGGVDHDATANYDANKHIDHTGVSITTAANSGLAGGGDISSTRTLVLDINNLNVATPAAGDFIAFWDITATAASKKITFANFQTALGVLTDELVGVDSGATPGYLGAAFNDGVLRTSTGISYADGGNFITLTTNDGEINHDALSNYVANKHINHTGVSISSGTGLTGGGAITTTQTLSLSHLGIESLTDPGGDRIMFWDDVGAAAVTWLVVSTGLQITTTNFTTKDSEIIHDNLSGYDSNKHIDHTGVTLTAGSGLAGGGTIATGRTFDLDINSLDAASIAAGDFIAFWDITATATNKKITFANLQSALGILTDKLVGIDSGATPGYLGAASSDGVLRASTGISYADGGDFITLTTNDGEINHDSLSGYDAAKHVTLPGTIANVLSDHTLAAHVTLGLQETISSNATYYIATGGDDGTGDGSSGSPWATLDHTLDYLSTKLIAAGVTVTIQFGDGTYTRTATDTIDHANGDKIVIQGENTHSKTLSSIQSSSGTAGSWAIILNLNSIADIAVNDYVLIPATVTGGTYPKSLSGCWKITNVDAGNTRITVTSTDQYATAPSGAVSGTVIVVKTILVYTDVTGLEISSGSVLGGLNKVVFEGTGAASTNGLYLENEGIATCGPILGISNFNSGMLIEYGSSLVGDYSCISSCVYSNLQVNYAFAQIRYGAFSGGTARGAYAITGTIVLHYAVSTGNGTNAIWAEVSGNINIYAGFVSNNIGTGIYSFFNSMIETTSATVTNNGTDYTPAVNTLGNIESYNRG